MFFGEEHRGSLIAGDRITLLLLIAATALGGAVLGPGAALGRAALSPGAARGRAALSPGAARAGNPVVTENSKAGDGVWMEAVNADSFEAAAPISGYADATSVRPGGTIGFHVSVTTAGRYRVEIERLGWYGGQGGRLLTCLTGALLDPTCRADQNALVQGGPPPPAPATHEIDAGWKATDELTVPGNWVSGYYVAIFHLTTGAGAGHTGFAPFIVQAPAGDHSQILVQVPTNTWQAYNLWGGLDVYTKPRSVKVSFNRPYLHRILFDWEYPLVRFLERSGYDVTYATDDDVDRDPSILLHHRLDIVAGHSEYWTKAMRDGWEAARDSGVNLAFMGANTAYWQVRYEDHDRTMVSYKFKPDPDPNPAEKTTQFRLLVPPRPECQLIGGQYQTSTWLSNSYLNYTVTAAGASNPWFAGSGLTAGTVLAGLVGYEFDAVSSSCHVPPVTSLLHASGPPVQQGGPPVLADATRYRACSGAEVFNAGSFQLAWGLDAFRDPAYVPPSWPVPPPASPGLQRVMTNAINDMLVSHVPRPEPPQICVPRPAFAVTPAFPVVGQPVRFTSTSVDPYGYIGQLTWSLGARRAAGATVTRRFGHPGSYRITLQAVDTGGAGRSVTQVVTVRAQRKRGRG
jgi:hypothetical protein